MENQSALGYINLALMHLEQARINLVDGAEHLKDPLFVVFEELKIREIQKEIKKKYNI